LRIFILNPVLEDVSERRATLRGEVLKELLRIAPSDVELESGGLDRGASTIESYYDEYVGAADMVEKSVEAEKRGCDAVVINCFMNPGLEGLRELLDIPVVGAGEASLCLASILGDHFTVLDTDPPHRSYTHKLVSTLGLTHRLRSVRYLSLGVAGLYEDFNQVLDKMVGEAVKAVEEDGAHVIVLGCTGMRRYADKLSEKMREYGVPVVEPLSAAVNLAALLVRLGLKQSKLSYPKPSEKRRVA
jgi:allantoin racemase